MIASTRLGPGPAEPDSGSGGRESESLPVAIGGSRVTVEPEPVLAAAESPPPGRVHEGTANDRPGSQTRISEMPVIIRVSVTVAASGLPVPSESGTKLPVNRNSSASEHGEPLRRLRLEKQGAKDSDVTGDRASDSEPPAHPGFKFRAEAKTSCQWPSLRRLACVTSHGPSGGNAGLIPGAAAPGRSRAGLGLGLGPEVQGPASGPGPLYLWIIGAQDG
jgi:hypothetical protein